jgi:hypothetical protein
MLGPAAAPERTYDELAAEDVNGDLVAVIPLPVWSRIRLDGLEHAILVAAEHGDAVDVNSLIARAIGKPAATGPRSGNARPLRHPVTRGYTHVSSLLAQDAAARLG